MTIPSSIYTILHLEEFHSTDTLHLKICIRPSNLKILEVHQVPELPNRNYHPWKNSEKHELKHSKKYLSTTLYPKKQKMRSEIVLSLATKKKETVPINCSHIDRHKRHKTTGSKE